MMKFVVFIISFLFCFSVYSDPDSMSDNIKEAEKSIVFIKVKFRKEEIIGTGFFIDEKTIVTNFHVISNFKSSFESPLGEISLSRIKGLSALHDLALLEVTTQLSIESPLGEISLSRIKGLSALHDLALLEVTTNFQVFPLEVGSTEGHLAYSIGYPDGKWSVVNLQNAEEEGGEIRASRDQSKHLGGLSGGPILDQQNKLIGIVYSSTAFMIFGTPTRVLERLMTQSALPSNSFSELIKTEIENLNVLAIEGDFKAQYRLGVFYFVGAGVRQDVVTARTWLLKSAEQGYAPSQTYVGYLYEIGRGFIQSHSKAQEWYERAAEQGYEPAVRRVRKNKAKSNACPQSINQLQ